jgi:hypothetical protein
MALRDLDDFLVVEPFVLPIRGRDYAFPGEISARTWLKVQRLGPEINQAMAAKSAGEEFDADSEALSDVDQEELMVELCGDALQDMLDDGLTSAHLKAVLVTLIAFHLVDRETAENVWNAQGEAQAPNRETRRAKTPATSTRSRGSRAASTPRQSAGPAKARPGKRSSTTGS